jgi:hypothetical protein
MERDDSSPWDSRSEDAVISPAQICAALWRSRFLFFAVLICVAALATAGLLHFAKYESEGLLQFGGPIPIPRSAEFSTIANLGYNAEEKKPPPGIGFSDYKLFAAFYSTTERFDRFVHDNNIDTTEAIQALRGRFVSPESVDDVLEPVYALTKQDAKNLVGQANISSNNIIGLRISFAAKRPEVAQKIVSMLGRYAMDSIAYVIYAGAVPADCAAIKTKLVRYDAFILGKSEHIGELKRRADYLKDIARRYPDSANAARQVVTVTEESARYLPPVTLLATTEVEESEAREAIYKANIEKSKASLLLEYCERVSKMIASTNSGEAVVRNLEKTKDEVFKDKNLGEEAVKEVYQGITIANRNAMWVYLDNSRFVAGPTLPNRPSMRPSKALLIGLAIGFVCAAVAVFVKRWWIRNRAMFSG